MREITSGYGSLNLLEDEDIESLKKEELRPPGSPAMPKQKAGEMRQSYQNAEEQRSKTYQRDTLSASETVYSDDGAILLAASMESPEADYETGTFTVRPGCRVIASKAFMYQDKLRHVILPDTVEVIGDFAFACSGIEEFDAPSSLRTIEEKAFFRCHNLKTVNLNEGLQAIEREAFANSGIESIDIPSTVRHIGRHILIETPIERQPNAAGFTIAGNPVYSRDEDGGLYRHAPNGAILMEMLSSTSTTHRILEGTIGIAKNSYMRAANLESVELPEGLRVIGQEAYIRCNKLRSIKIPESLRAMGSKALARTDIRELYLPRGFKHLGVLALDTGSEIHSSLMRIDVHPENERFYTQGGLLCERIAPDECRVVVYYGPEEHVTIPRECTVVGPYVFSRQHGIRSIRLHKDIRSIDRFALKALCRVDRLIVELPEPEEGSDIAEIVFPRKSDVPDPLLGIFPSARIDASDIFKCSDKAAYYACSNYERALLMCRRLSHPQYLMKTNRDLFVEAIQQNLMSFCMAFAKHGYTKGLEQLVELGFLTKENLGEVIDQVIELKDANVTGFLLELKERFFGSGVSDDYFSL